MDVNNYLGEWASRYEKDLKTDIMPFWLKYGLDRKHGGVYTCVDRDGTLMDTTKSVWFQGRFGFTAAFAYNHIEKNPEWLAASKSCIDFIEKYCSDKDGHMYFEITDDGVGLRKRRYVFSECFAAIAMSEYSLATGDKAYAQKALEMFKRIQKFLNTPGFLEAKYEPVFQARSHSITMILVNTAAKVRESIQDPILDKQIDDSIDAIAKYFMHPEYKALLETVGPNGEFIDTLNCRTINPGHCIETSWFIMEEARRRNWDKKLVDMALQIFDWSFKWGWDEQFGGIINFKDCRNFPNQDYSQDMKFWWPQTETIIASLYAYLATGDQKYMDIHKRVSDWTYSHFPDPKYGEWFGYLHRDGTPAQMAKGNIFKGPFHILRMMTQSYMLCNDIIAKNK
jgi:N-acylglucosamine 2-epimerase